MKYICEICGYVYDEEVEGVKFDDLPADWKCPMCGVDKSLFKKEEAKSKEIDVKAFYNIGYGLYVITTNDGKKDNGMIANSVIQLTTSPNRVLVSINKNNYTYEIIQKTKKMNVNCLSVNAPFLVFESFGFVSGRTVDKFANCKPSRSSNGLVVLPKYINGFISLQVESYLDLETHGVFICSVEEAKCITDEKSMTYDYYQNNVKPKREKEKKQGWVCRVCGYVYEGETLPVDFICPLCKHGVEDFEKL